MDDQSRITDPSNFDGMTREIPVEEARIMEGLADSLQVSSGTPEEQFIRDTLHDGNGIVQIAYLHGEQVSHSFAESLRRAWHHDRTYGSAKTGEPVLAEHPLNIRASSGQIPVRRNFATRLFLEKTEHEWLMFIDSDMGFQPDAIYRLLEAAHPVDSPVVGGLCFAQMEVIADGYNGFTSTVVPTMYRIGDKTKSGHPSFCFYGPYEPDKMCQVAGTGAAFLLIHRSVLLEIAHTFGPSWWDEMYDADGDIVGEDLAFCLRVNHHKRPVFVHTGVPTTHHKGQWIGEEHYMRQQAVATLQTVDPTQVGPPEVPPFVDVTDSLATLALNRHVQGGMLKLTEDLDRYRHIITTTKPEVIVETGTWTGASAKWFRDSFGVDVITVDTQQSVAPEFFDPALSYVLGDSVEPKVVDFVRSLVDGRRCMVILDSDHSAKHVGREIEAYGPMVTDGCYLVVEDGIFAYASDRLREHHTPGMVGSPLDAVAVLLASVENDPDRAFTRDVFVERMHTVSHHPGGWWMRVNGKPEATDGGPADA